MRLSSRTKGIISIIASAFGFALMAMFVRLCDDFGEPISSFQKSFFRNALALVLALVVFLRGRASVDLCRVSRRGWFALLARSVFGTIGIFSNFYALGRIPIAEGQTLNKTAPFFTVVFAAWFLKEKVTLRRLVVLAIAFVGIVLVAKPGFAGEQAFPLAMGLLGGVCAGAAYATVRYLGILKVSSPFIILFFSAFSCLASVPFMCHHYDPMTFAQVLTLLGAGLGATIGQFGITLAYRYSSPREIAVFDYTNIIFTAALGYICFAQVPDVFSIIGFVVIIVAAFGLQR